MKKFLKVPVILGITMLAAMSVSAAAQPGTTSKSVGTNYAALTVSNGYGYVSGAYVITSGSGVGFDLNVTEHVALIESQSKSTINGSIWTMNSQGGTLPKADATLTYGVYGSASSMKSAQIKLQSVASTKNGKNIQVKNKTVTVKDGKKHPTATLEVTY